jgi:hypothetical protein
MQHKPTTAFVSILVFLVSLTALSQEYRINNFGIREGITHPFVYTINQDNQGFIWIGTGEGLCRFNGFTFNTDIIQDSLAGEVVGISFKDSRNKLWFGYHSGKIANYDGRAFKMLAIDMDINSAITGFAELSEGILLVSTLNNGLFTYNTNSDKSSSPEGIETGIYTALLVKGNTMLLGSQEGLAIYSITEARLP